MPKIRFTQAEEIAYREGHRAGHDQDGWRPECPYADSGLVAAWKAGQKNGYDEWSDRPPRCPSPEGGWQVAEFAE